MQRQEFSIVLSNFESNLSLKLFYSFFQLQKSNSTAALNRFHCLFNSQNFKTKKFVVQNFEQFYFFLILCFEKNKPTNNIKIGTERGCLKKFENNPFFNRYC